MRLPSIGFIGGGRVATILLGGLAKAGLTLEQVVVADANHDVLARLKERHAEIEISGDNSLAASREIVFLAVHPPLIADVLAQVGPDLRPDAILVSLAPKFTIDRLSQLLNGFGRIARMIPNAPSIIGAGYNPIAYADSLSASDRQSLGAVLGALGECFETAESKLEAYALITAMGPTYFWFQLRELISLAESFGMTPEEATSGVCNMLQGAAQTMSESGLSPDDVIDLIPVKPLAELEATITEAYRDKLTGLLQKIRP
ncbi:pyrroline-5-carboxylate reductase family protein [Candidatus Sumerlaeota bacterium]